jgi:hypothetical protein
MTVSKGGAGTARLVRQQGHLFFFEKKEPKNFCLIPATPNFPLDGGAVGNLQKFFGSFFQKRTCFLRYVRARSSA